MNRVAVFDDDLTMDDEHEFEHSRSKFSVDGIMQSIRNFASLSEALRVMGAAVLLASMSVFLLQGWNEGNDISRTSCC